MALERIPAGSFWPVSTGEEEPGEEAGEVLHGAVELEGVGWCAAGVRREIPCLCRGLSRRT